MQLPDLEPGTWAEWANAIATTLAFTVALVLFVIGLRDRRRANEDRLRDQARKVWIWLVSWEGGRSSTKVDKIRYRIVKGSDDPITDCEISIKGHEDSHILFDAAPDVHVLPARQDVELKLEKALEVSLDSMFTSNISGAWPGPPLQLKFTDAAGIRWLRQSDGLLKPTWRRQGQG